jgi:hypothetical protein
VLTMRICFVIGAFGVRVSASRVTTGEFTITSSIHDSDPMVGTTVDLNMHVTGESGKTDNEGYEDYFEPLTGHGDDPNESLKDTALLESIGDSYTNAGSADDSEDDFEPETAQEAGPMPSQKVIDDKPSLRWRQYDDMIDEASDEHGDDFETEADNSREALDWDGVAELLEDDDSDVGLDNFDFHAIRGEDKKGKESGTRVIDAPSGLGWDHIASLLESRTNDETLERDVNRNEGEQEIHNTEFNDDTLTKTKGSLGIGWDEIEALLKTDSEETNDRSTDQFQKIGVDMHSTFADISNNQAIVSKILETVMPPDAYHLVRNIAKSATDVDPSMIRSGFTALADTVQHRATTYTQYNKALSPETISRLLSPDLDYFTMTVSDKLFDARKGLVSLDDASGVVTLSAPRNYNPVDPETQRMQFEFFLEENMLKLVELLSTQFPSISKEDIERDLKRASRLFSIYQLGVAQNVMIDEVVKLIHTKIEKLWTKEQYCPPGPALVDGDVNVDRLTRLLVIPTDHSDLYIKARLAKLIETLNIAC